MSQQQFFGDGGSPGVPGLETLTGNTGGAVSGSGSPVNINLVGDTAQGVAVNGNAGTSTETVTVGDATAAATSGAASKGVSSYNSADFTVVNGYVSLANDTQGTGQTIGATTADIITFPLGATPGTYAFEGRVSGFNASTPASCAFQIFGTVRTTGAAGVLVGVPDYVSNDEAAVNGADAEIVVSGNNAIIRVTGVLALTIDWAADLQYTFRG